MYIARRTYILVVAVLLLPSQAHTQAATLTFPGLAPCDTTLQACIDNVSAGNIVEVATNGPIDESPRIERSLTLRAAAGYKPRFPALNTISAFTSSSADEEITIEGFVFETGRIFAGHGGSGVLKLRILNNLIEKGFRSRPGIDLFTGTQGEPRGFIDFEIADNTITIPDSSSSGIAISLTQAPEARGVIARNRIVMDNHTSDSGGGIAISNSSNGLVVDVIANEISGSGYNVGIQLFQFADEGRLVARVLNNTVTGQTDIAGRPGAISASCSEGVLDATLVNNTLVENESGISLGGRDDLGASCVGLVANNVMAFNSDLGLSIDEDFQETVPNRNNLVFGNSRTFFVPGPGTVFANPRLRDDFRPKNNSPVIDAGRTNSVPLDLPADRHGDPRIFGTAVDIGALEFVRKCDGVLATLVGTSDDDDLTGTPGRDVIVGLGGNDRINGAGGADLICGNAGNDELAGGDQNDILLGGSGQDTLMGQKGKDTLSGGPDDDLLDGGLGRDVLDGGSGQDDCQSGATELRCEP